MEVFFFWHVKKVFPMDLVPLAGEGRKDIRTFKKNLRFVFFFFCEKRRKRKKNAWPWPRNLQKVTRSYT